MEHRELLERLGTNTYLAPRFGVSESSVSRWRTVGIPPTHWVVAAMLARERGLKGITAETIARDAGPRRPKALVG